MFVSFAFVVVVTVVVLVSFAKAKSAVIEPAEFRLAIVLATVLFAIEIPLVLFHETKPYPLNAVALIDNGTVELHHNVPDGLVQPSELGET